MSTTESARQLVRTLRRDRVLRAKRRRSHRWEEWLAQAARRRDARQCEIEQRRRGRRTIDRNSLVSLDSPLGDDPGSATLGDILADPKQQDPADVIVATEDESTLRGIVGDLDPEDIANLSAAELSALRESLTAVGLTPHVMKTDPLDGAGSDFSDSHWSFGWQRQCGWAECERRPAWHIVWETGERSVACPTHALDAYDVDPAVVQHQIEPECKVLDSVWDQNTNTCWDAATASWGVG